MTNARVLAYAALLGLLALVTQWLLWLERPGDRGDTFVGPSRSDYVALDYVLVARDTEGGFAFEAIGPRAVRHPFLGSFDLETPRLWKTFNSIQVREEGRVSAISGLRVREDDLLRLPLYAAEEVDAPHLRCSRGETQLRQRNSHLDCPSGRIDACRDGPHGIPPHVR